MIRISGKDGWKGIVHSWWGGSPQDAHQITVRLDNGEKIVISDAVLTGRPDGSYYVPLSLAEIRRGAGTPRAEGEPAVEQTAPLQEVNPLGVKKTALQETQTIDVPLLHEEVDIERVPVDRIVDGPVAVRSEGDTIIVPVMEEVVVVQKQLKVVEEVHIRKRRTKRHDPQDVLLRKEMITVEPKEGQDGTDDLRII